MSKFVSYAILLVALVMVAHPMKLNEHEQVIPPAAPATNPTTRPGTPFVMQLIHG